MENIKTISIVCATGANVYSIGFTMNGKIISKIERIPGYEDSEGVIYSGRFDVKDKDGEKIAEISDIVPYVIDFE